MATTETNKLKEGAIAKETGIVVDERQNKIALATIYQGIPEDVLLSVAEKETAKEAWETIRTLCQGAERVKRARVQTLKGEFEFMCMKDADSLDDLCLKLNGLVTHIRTLRETVTDSYVVKKLLRAMPTKYLQIVSTMEQFGDIENMTVEEAIGSLKAHEERLRGQTEKGGGQLMLTEEEWARRESEEGKLLLTNEEWMKRNKANAEVSHAQKNRGKDGSRWNRDKSRVRCYNCQAYGHFATDCRRSKRDKEIKVGEVNIAQVDDDEPALLFT
ncbi:uncharacterized protein LOC141720091 [Apium graveolens]|uniref:uncharacterized protein LOC141720091 n=1 Tax=Apium graveolens TaxID=4045 RepID=UPI003D7A3C69